MFIRLIAIALVVLGSGAPARAQDAPPMSPPQKMPLEQRCYYAVEAEWNNAIATNSDSDRFETVYGHFAKCAELAVKAQAWPVYFADTYGAMYAQIQLAGLATKPALRCRHYVLAKDLGEQAQIIQESSDEKGAALFADSMDSVLRELRDKALMCTGGPSLVEQPHMF